MKLISATIKNYRSIEEETFVVEEKDGGHTFTLIGINESGKSTFLRAISLIDTGEVLFSKDFHDDKKPIEIFLTYKLEPSDEKDLKQELIGKAFDKDLISKIDISKVEVCVSFEPIEKPQRKNFDRIYFKNDLFKDYTLTGTAPVKKTAEQSEGDFDVKKYFATTLDKYFWKVSHHITFWKSDGKYLINDQINLDTFIAKPEEISIPLMNCFRLAGIEDITTEINKIKTNPAEINNLQEKLGDEVTAHVRKVWPDHPIKIRFQINNMMLSFLVEDDDVKYASKTTDQRSDGFKQFISFLLTVSAESANDEMSNSLLLLDEPETHLHPQAQECLKDELIKITKNKDNNIVIFATHSNYMIDKNLLDRCYRVYKEKNKVTKIEKIEGKKISYAEVNYEIFGISSNDYHNELYGFLEDTDKAKLDNLLKDKKWYNSKTSTTSDVSLATYIRHSIHHPENGTNTKFTNKELLDSIKSLRKLKYPSKK